MYCKHCGKEIEDNSLFCKYCGGNLGENVTVKEVQYIAIQQPKSQFVAIILCIFLGELGIHDFYMGKNGCGMTKLLILILLGWIVVGFIINGLCRELSHFDGTISIWLAFTNIHARIFFEPDSPQ